jgi:hypothetical protein
VALRNGAVKSDIEHEILSDVSAIDKRNRGSEYAKASHGFQCENVFQLFAARSGLAHDSLDISDINAMELWLKTSRKRDLPNAALLQLAWFKEIAVWWDNLL